MNELAVATMEKPVVYMTESGEVSLSINHVTKFVATGSKSVTIPEAIRFLQLCKYNKLNPYVGDAYLIKYGNDATMVTSKYAYMKRAERAGDKYEGFRAGVVLLPKDWEKKFVETGEAPEPIYREGTLTLNMEIIGGWADVHVQGRKFPVRAEIDFNEFVGRKGQEGEINSMWKKKPGTMIRKCALVGALREAFPDVFGSLVSEDEIPEILDNVAPEIDPDKVIDIDTKPDENPDPGPSIEPKRRARRHVTSYMDEEIKTCGVSGAEITSIENAESKGDNFAKIIDDYLKGVGANDLTFLRKDESAELMNMLGAQMMEKVFVKPDETKAENPEIKPSEQKQETGEETPKEEEAAKEDPETGTEYPKKNVEEKIPCPDRGDIEVDLSFCQDQCPKFDDKTCKLFEK